jgi:hypothetical protein
MPNHPQPKAGNHLVHSSSMTTPFGLPDVQLFEERAGRADLFLDGSLEFFRLLA